MQGVGMKVELFVMAYGIEQDRIRALLPEGKEFCDCEFTWRFHEEDACGRSIGKTLQAFPEESKAEYPRQLLTAENAAAISCGQVLGAYIVKFERKTKYIHWLRKASLRRRLFICAEEGTHGSRIF